MSTEEIGFYTGADGQTYRWWKNPNTEQHGYRHIVASSIGGSHDIDPRDIDAALDALLDLADRETEKNEKWVEIKHSFSGLDAHASLRIKLGDNPEEDSIVQVWDENKWIPVFHTWVGTAFEWWVAAAYRKGLEDKDGNN